MATFRDYLLVCYSSLYPTHDDSLNIVIEKYEHLIALHQRMLSCQPDMILRHFPDAEATLILLIAELQHSLQTAKLLQIIQEL